MGGEGVTETVLKSPAIYWGCYCDRSKNFEGLDNKEKPLVGDTDSDMSAIFKEKCYFSFLRL